MNTADLYETLDDLREDVHILCLMLEGLGMKPNPMDRQCLLRVSSYLEQHTDDLCRLVKRAVP